LAGWSSAMVAWFALRQTAAPVGRSTSQLTEPVGFSAHRLA
jgi:hypothetical protein